MESVRRARGLAVPVLVVFAAGTASGAVTITDNVTDESQNCFKIETATATYYYDKGGASFTSMVDVNGNDWVNYHTSGGASGNYRGLPKIAHQVFGHADLSGATTTQVNSTTLNSTQGSWDVTWEFFDTHAKMTINSVGDLYWLSYEGTPGGTFQDTDVLWRSNGQSNNCSGSWNSDIANTSGKAAGSEWVYFADADINRSLFLIHTDDSNVDTYYAMSPMTVFGFGRDETKATGWYNLTQTGTHLIVGLVDSRDYNAVGDHIDSIWSGGGPSAPAVTTNDATNISTTSARLNGNLTSTGGENPTVKIYWGDNDGGTGSWDHEENLGTKGTGTFYKDIAGLNPNTSYYFRCYAENSAGGTWASSSKSFKTLASITKPTVVTKPASSVTAVSARLNGEVTATGGENPTVKIYWGTTDGGTTAASWTYTEDLGAKGAGTFYKDVTGLSDGTTYYFRCFATNSGGDSWASSSQNFTATAPVGGLVGHWEFDDGSGSTATDSSAKGNDGTVNGATWTTGKIGTGALSFGGSDSDYVEIPNETDYDLADAVSYAVWIKMDPGSQSWAGVVTKGDHMNIQRHDVDSYVVWQTKDSPGTISQYQLDEKANVVDGQWHHVAVTFDGSEKCIYVDGALSNSAAATGYINTTDYPIIMGKNGSAAGHAFKGVMDDVRIYDYALAAGEVKALYDMGSGGDTGPAITQQPQNVTVDEGQSATFTVAAKWTGALHYQWYEDGAKVGTDSATYTISSTTLSQNGHKFHCVVTDSGGTATSNQATLTVNPPAGQAPTITQQPQNATVSVGGTATFTVTATASAGTLSYQWKKDGTDISGATSASYTTPAATTADNGAKFTCVVTDGNGSVTSSAATLTVIVDTDGDGLPDSWEQTYGLNPNSMDTDGDGTLDPNEDADGDGYTNLEEYQKGTNPNVSDADGKDTTGVFGCSAGAGGVAGGAALALLLAALCVLALRVSRAEAWHASRERSAVGWIGRRFY